jgi:hypothetical protein
MKADNHSAEQKKEEKREKSGNRQAVLNGSNRKMIAKMKTEPI